MKEEFKEVKKELMILAALLIAIAIVFKIIYYNESIVVVLRTVLAIFWLFVIPGYFFMLNWRSHLGLPERLVVGSALSAGLVGIVSYYAGIIGIGVSWHWALAPFVLIIIGIFLFLIHFNLKNKNETEIKN